MPPPCFVEKDSPEQGAVMIFGILCLLASAYGWWYYANVMSDTKTLLGAVVLAIGGLLLCLMANIRRIKQRHQEKEL